MALQPNLRPLIIAGNPGASQAIEVFLDYICPFSKKLANTFDSDVINIVNSDEYSNRVKIIFRNQVQPWHASSTLVHEAGLAVAAVAPEQFWAFSIALFRNQDEFFDIPTSSLSPSQIRDKLQDLAASVIGQGKAKEVRDLLTNKSSPNGGVAVTDTLKYTIKFSRQNGVHVSPTVFLDGLVRNEISSSWTAQQWKDFLAQNIAK